MQYKDYDIDNPINPVCRISNKHEILDASSQGLTIKLAILYQKVNETMLCFVLWHGSGFTDTCLYEPTYIFTYYYANYCFMQ